MKRLYLLIFIFSFNFVVSQDNSGESGFDSNRKVQNLDENELIFQLTELEEEELKSDLVVPENLEKIDSLPYLDDSDIVVEIGENKDLDTPPEPLLSNSVTPIPSPKKPSITDGLGDLETQNIENQPITPQERITSPAPTANQTQTVPTPPVQDKFKALSKKQIHRLQYAKNLYNNGKFYALIKSQFENNEFEALYYQALACYNILKKNKNYHGGRLSQTRQNEKIALINKAKDNLFQTGRFAPNSSLKERAVFWYAILSITYPNNYRDEKELTDTFLFIEESMKNSNVYNDALIYLTLIYKKLGKITKAKEFYRKALRTSPDDLVYNYKTDTMVPAKALWILFKDLK